MAGTRRPGTRKQRIVDVLEEAYVGHFSWDLRRFAASLALLGWRKALPESTVRDLTSRYVRGYLRQVDHYRRSEGDTDFGLYLDTSEGPVLELLTEARLLVRRDFLDQVTVVDGACVFRGGPGVRRLPRDELPACTLLVEGYSQALGNDVVLSMKQANVPAVSRFVDNEHIERYLDHEGHRTVVSQRALQVHTDPLLGHTDLGGRG